MFSARIVDLVVADESDKPSISFVVAGDPPVQQRPKMKFKGRLNKNPIYYDPSSIEKINWKRQLKKALFDYGVKEFPLYQDKNTNQMKSSGLQIDIMFYLCRRREDYRSRKGVLVLKDNHQKYPGKKDTDNMLKFVMVAAHDVLYDDDKCVVKISASKEFVTEEEKEAGAYTTIRITTL